MRGPINPTRDLRNTINPTGMETPVTGWQHDVTDGNGNKPSLTTQVGQWWWFKHDTNYTWRGRVQNAALANNGWSDWSSGTARTARLEAGTPKVMARSTRALTIDATAGTVHGTTRTLFLAGPDYLGINREWQTNGTSGFFDGLKDGMSFTATQRNTDGYNTVNTVAPGITTNVLPVPAPPACSVTVIDGTEYGSLRVNGGDQVRMSGIIKPGGSTYSGLAYGAYTGYARNLNTDGLNNKYSGWNNCGQKAIGQAPPYTSATCATIFPFSDIDYWIWDQWYTDGRWWTTREDGGTLGPMVERRSSWGAGGTGVYNSYGMRLWKGSCLHHGNRYVYNKFGASMGYIPSDGKNADSQWWDW